MTAHVTDSWLAEHDPDPPDDVFLPTEFPDTTLHDEDFVDRYRELEYTVSQASQKLPFNVAKAIRALAGGLTDANSITALAREHRTTPATLKTHLASRAGQDLYGSMALLTRLKHGPLRAQRIAMAWRIALACEESAPRIALQALDYLSKVSGDYVQELRTDTGVTVVVQQFNNKIPDMRVHTRREKETHGEVVEFKPVTIDV